MSHVRTADRTLGIFEAFESTCRPMSLSELAEQAEVPVSSCHGLVQTLLDRGYLYWVSRRKDIYPTRRLLDVAQTIVSHDPFLERIEPFLEQLRDGTEETVILGKRQGDSVLYLEVVPGLHTVRYTANAGEYKPLHSSSIGKLMLGSMKKAELDRWLASHELPAITSNTINDIEKLRADLEESRRRGYFMTQGENVADVTALAAPVQVNDEVLGLAVAGPTHRMAVRSEEHARRLLEARQAIEEAFQ
ncbi:MAG TPA: IclR family transcriptional regulator [Noviherbaspirillum sp.]|uniref:IclR family transcriptional regulator n=1 Tax=Noviherbaspirillum sp. TaxID=1926288 RepID=UPI002B4658F7|nr:IclR family transcriptional regulator [Noviherbaspirillum sp.]HJV84968.1 IclR family transcriptional regulator [Noviherbaspirillum sp.]